MDPAGDLEVVTEAAKVVEAACTKSEDNKVTFMSLAIGEAFHDALSYPDAVLPLVSSVSRAVVKLTTADDDRPPVSRYISLTLNGSRRFELFELEIPDQSQCVCALM